MQQDTNTAHAHSILLVEDDDLLRRSLAKLLFMFGFEVVDVPSAEAALDIVGHQRVDIVLADYRLPGINGVDFARTLRTNKVGKPVVMMTGFGSPTFEEDAADAGVVAVLHKPIDFHALELLLHKLDPQ